MEINEIKNPDFLKNMSILELQELSHDMRNFILQNVSKTGGHLSSNLGVVDLTIALLKVFDANKDVFLFDVGHQCYPYKILTGRANKFNTLRQKGGLSGFQNISESKYDKFEAGHSSTSISTGLGMAYARDLDGKNNEIISIIGDGSISNGLAYEALNQLGADQKKQIIILNDNQMSISRNVGAIHNFLDRIRSDRKYKNVKKGTKNVLNKSKVGKSFYKFLDTVKDWFKKLYLRKASLFDDFQIEYYGPINGHDYNELIKYLTIAKNETKPVILHVITQKGKGYNYAEEDKFGKYHGIDAFDVNTGDVLSKSNLPSYSEVMSSFTTNLLKKNKDIVCITPGMSYGSNLDYIKENFPKQFIDTGIAEEHAILLANGLALSGKKPILFIYSTFLQRCYDEIVHDVARMNKGVTVCVDRSGLIGKDGVSHQGVFDVPMLLSIPNVVISCPHNALEANNLLTTAVESGKPFFIRYPKSNVKYDFPLAQKLTIGSWEILKNGTDGIIISYGEFVNKAVEVSDALELDGLKIGVVNARFLKPIDEKMFVDILYSNLPIFVYEESMQTGSLGSFLLTKASNYNISYNIKLLSIEDKFLTHASREELIKMCHLDNESVINFIKSNIKK